MKKQVTSFEMSVFAFYVMRASFVGVTLNSLILIAEQDSYLSILLGFIIGFLPILLYLSLMNIKKNYNFTDLVENYLGRKLGTFINILLCLFLTYFATLIFWNLVNLITSQYLSRTPAIAVSILFIIPTIYMLSKGITVIGRCSVLFFYLCIILVFLPILGLVFQIQIENIMPILYHGITPVLKGSYFYIASSVLPIFLLLSIPKDMIRDDHKFNKYIIIMYCITSFAQFCLLFLTITVFSSKLATIYQYPEFHLLKRVSIIGFIQRVESMLSIQWIFDIFLSNILTLYFVLQYIFKKWKVKESRKQNILISIVSVFVLLISNYVFQNNTIGTTFFKDIFPLLLYIFFLILPLSIMLFSKMKKNKSV